MIDLKHDIEAFIEGSIAAGFTAEVYQDHGINAKQVTDFARLMIRAAGVYESHDIAGMKVAFVGHAANNVQVFMLDGEAVGTYEWLERAAKFLDVQFSKSLGIEPRAKNLCHFCTGTSPAAGETYFDECDNCRASLP